MNVLPNKWPERSWHFPNSRFRREEAARARGDAVAVEMLGDEFAAKSQLESRICVLYELETTSGPQRRWLRHRWARYCRVRRWLAMGSWGYAEEVREIEREIAVAETRIEAMLGAPAATPARVREAV